MAPSGAAGDDWLGSQESWDADGPIGDLGQAQQHARDMYPVSLEDLGDLGSPFASQFPDLPLDVNPFYHAIETDRAAFTPAISTSPIGRMIIESGYSFIANRHLPSEHSFPEILLRFGLSENIELRFGWNDQLGGGASIVSPIQRQEGLAAAALKAAPISYQNGFVFGAKLRLISQSGWIPANTVIVQGYKPTFGDTLKGEVDATYIVGWEFAPRWQLNGALRYATESEFKDDWAIWSPSVVFKAPFAERWTASIEYFSVIPQGQSRGVSQHFAGPGLQFLITPDAQVNLRVGTGLSSVSPEFYMTIGLGLAF